MIGINREEVVNADQSSKRKIFNHVNDCQVDGIEPPRKNAVVEQHRDPSGQWFERTTKPH